MAKWTQEQKDAAKIAYAEKMEKAKIDKDPSNFIQKVEKFNGEEVPVIETTGMNRWDRQDMIDSIINTIKILPPNMIKNGRHLKENIQAINVFKVTDELIDEAYQIFQHDLD